MSNQCFGSAGHKHCTIEWDGEEAATSAVIVTDLNSSNGTFVSTPYAFPEVDFLPLCW